MEKITVGLQERSYPIHIGAGLFEDLYTLLPLRSKDSVMLVTNPTVESLYAEKIANVLKGMGLRVDQAVLPDGEHYKTLATLEHLFTALLENQHGRDTTLIALGGGVIGDITGFAAASYQRGVRYIQLPTTLLAQVDSSVGGKTGVNHPLGKNMVGAFWQPAAVIIDVDCLSTLPKREFTSGMAEVVKYGIIADADFFTWIEAHLAAILALETPALTYCIRRCCELKAQVVAADEFETGQRALLNLGHTFGHAIETHLGYGTWLHGEAVAAGMIMAAKTAQRLGLLPSQQTERIRHLLARLGLPTNGPKEMSPEDYLPHMLRDKKVQNGQLRLVLPRTIGCADVLTNVAHDVVLAAINDS